MRQMTDDPDGFENYLTGHPEYVTDRVADEARGQAVQAAMSGHLSLAMHVNLVREALLRRLGRRPEWISCHLDMLSVMFNLTDEPDELGALRERAQRLAAQGEETGEPAMVFRALRQAADCAYFAAVGSPRHVGSPRGGWLLAALDDAVAATRWTTHAARGEFEAFVSLLAGLADLGWAHIWLDEDHQRRATARFTELAGFAHEQVPVDYEFTAVGAGPQDRAARTHGVAVSLAMMSAFRTHADPAWTSVTERVRCAMDRAERSDDLDRWLDAAGTLHRVARRMGHTEDALRSIRQQIRARGDALRHRYRSRLGRLWAAQRLEPVLGELLEADLLYPGLSHADLFEAVERLKARTLLDELAGLYRPPPEGLADTLAEQEGEALRFAPSTQHGVVAQEMRYTSQLPLAGGTSDRQVAQRLAASEHLAQSLGIGYQGVAEVAKLAEVQASLDADELLCEYVIPFDGQAMAMQRTWLLAVTRDRTWLIPLPAGVLPDERQAGRLIVDGGQPIDGSPLITAVVNLRTHIRNGDDRRARRVLRRLFDHLVEPLTRLGRPLDGYSTITLIPHGPLHVLPWAALLDRRRRSLITHTALVTAPSASVWLALRRRPRDRAPSLIGLAASAVPGVSPLPFAEHEVTEAARLIGESAGRPSDVLALTSPRATLSALRTHAAGRGIVHLAAHGAFPEHDPMHFHQLLLDAGPTEAEGLRRLDLRAAWLTVLNVCDGGLYRFGPGDEPYGLVPAVLQAGSAAVLAPLWSVDDRRAATFMADFYRSLLTLGSAAALRRAMLGRIGKVPLRDWCGYVLVDAGRRP